MIINEKETILDVLHKYGFQTIDLDKYIKRNMSDIVNLSKEQLNSLQFKTIIYCIENNYSSMNFIFDNWEGIKPADYFYAFIERDSSFIINNLVDFLKEIILADDSKEILHDLIILMKGFKNESLKYNIFHYIEPQYNLLYNFLDDEIIDIIIDQEEYVLLSYLSNSTPKNVIDTVLKRVDDILVNDSIYISECILRHLDITKINTFVNKETIIKLYVDSLDSNDSFEKLKELEKYVPNLIDYVKETRFKFGEYILEKNYGITKNNISYDILIELSEDTIRKIITYSNLREHAESIILTKEFINNSSLSTKFFLDILDSRDLVNGEELYDLLYNQYGILLPSNINIQKLLYRMQKYPSLQKYVKVFTNNDLIKLINENINYIKMYYITFLLNELLSRNKENIKFITISKQFGIE